MTLKSEHPPLTWARIEQLACAGHDDFEPALNAPRARELVASAREHFGKENSRLRGYERSFHRLDGKLSAANATLARVRDRIDLNGCIDPSTKQWLLDALASHPDDFGLQAHTPGLASHPEAPRSPDTYEVWRGTEKRKDEILFETTDIEHAARTACADLSGQTFWGMKRQPEAPKGPAAEAEECCTTTTETA